MCQVLYLNDLILSSQEQSDIDTFLLPFSDIKTEVHKHLIMCPGSHSTWWKRIDCIWCDNRI